MARETKLGLLVGFGVILLIGIIVSDHLSQVNKDGADLTTFAQESQRGIAGGDVPVPPIETLAGNPGDNGAVAGPTLRQVSIIPTPGEGAVPPHTVTINNNPGSISGGVEVPGGNLGQAGTPKVIVMPGDIQNFDLPRPEPKPLATHTVAKGDSVYNIARKYYKDGEKWQLIRDANPGRVGSEGELQVNTQLKIPALPTEAPATGSTLFTDAPSLEPVPSHNAPAIAQEGVRVRIVEVRAGQNLTQIAREQLGNGARWQEILDANKDLISRPQDLKLGMKIKIPVSTGSAVTPATVTPVSAPKPAASPSAITTRTYTVKIGDNLTAIAGKTLGDRNKWKDILAANRDRLDSEDNLKVGQELVIPAMASR